MGLGWALGLINASPTHAGFQIRVWPGTKCELRARLRGVRQAIVDVCHKKRPSRVSNHLLSFVARIKRANHNGFAQDAHAPYRLGGVIRQKKRFRRCTLRRNNESKKAYYRPNRLNLLSWTVRPGSRSNFLRKI